MSDPLHTSGGLTATFANVNSAEAWGGGVATPLAWTFFETATEIGMRRALADFGALERSEVAPPEDRNRCFLNVFYGRPGSNVLLWRSVMDGIWGSSGAGYDEAFHAGEGGTERGGRRSGGSVLSACRFVATAILGRVVLARYRAKLLPWWQSNVAPGSTASVDEAVAKFGEAAVYNQRVIRPHSQVSWAGQSLLERLKARCAEAGLPGLELDLLASDDGFEEQGLINDIWAVSRDRISLEDLLRRWGFQGPVVGELSSRSWREDPSPLIPIIDAYRAKPDGQSPSTLSTRNSEARRRAEQKLLAGRSLVERIRIRILVSQVRTFVPLRQVGRGTFLKAYDVARCMARRIGEQMVADGVLADPDDVFYLTDSELLGGGLPGNVAALVSYRRERRRHYETLELPERWTGELSEEMVRGEVHVNSEHAHDEARPDRIEGLGVSSGVAEGRAIVVSSPDAAYDLVPGDILVCVATDPSWAALFYTVEALVTDVGAQMSHGAIVARQLGIPAVVNTRGATRNLRTGDRIRVDGSAGVVDVLERAVWAEETPAGTP